MALTVLFCRRERDSIKHIFWRCVYVKSFWEQFQTTLNIGSSNARTVTLNENFVLFGHDSQIKSDSTFDLIILRAKLYIYKSDSTFDLIILRAKLYIYKSDSTLDLIILRAKFYIYICKINKNIPQLHLFKQYLK